MDIEELREYAISKPGATESFPFGDSTLVFKLDNKVFLLVPLDTDRLKFNAKCDPERAEALREEYPSAILPGFHMNKKHWNTVVVDGSITKRMVLELVDHSYDLVAKKKKK